MLQKAIALYLLSHIATLTIKSKQVMHNLKWSTADYKTAGVNNKRQSYLHS